MIQPDEIELEQVTDVARVRTANSIDLPALLEANCSHDKRYLELYRLLEGSSDYDGKLVTVHKVVWRFFLLRARQGNSLAQVWVGNYLMSGQWGVEKNTKEAFEWYKTAALAGNSHALGSLAAFYRYGLSVKQDLDLASQYLQKSVRLGNKVALVVYLIWQLREKNAANKDTVISLVEGIVEADSSTDYEIQTAAQLLIKIYNGDFDGKKNVSKYLGWLKYAAHRHDLGAKRELGWLYLTGENGVDKNTQVGFELLCAAAKPSQLRDGFYYKVYLHYKQSTSEFERDWANDLIQKMVEEANPQAIEAYYEDLYTNYQKENVSYFIALLQKPTHEIQTILKQSHLLAEISIRHQSTTIYDLIQSDDRKLFDYDALYPCQQSETKTTALNLAGGYSSVKLFQRVKQHSHYKRQDPNGDTVLHYIVRMTNFGVYQSLTEDEIRELCLVPNFVGELPLSVEVKESSWPKNNSIALRTSLLSHCLSLAIQRIDLDLILDLLSHSKGVPVRVDQIEMMLKLRDSKGQSLLKLGCERDNIDLVTFIFANTDAYAMVQTHPDLRAFEYVASFMIKHHTNSAKLLVLLDTFKSKLALLGTKNKNTKTNYIPTAIFFAQSSRAALIYLLENCPEFKKVRDVNGDSLLVLACKDIEVELVTHILKQKLIAPLLRNMKGDTALHCAIRAYLDSRDIQQKERAMTIVKLLSAYKHLPNHDGILPLHLLIDAGETQQLVSLVEQKPTVLKRLRTRTDVLCLYEYAKAHSQFDIRKSLLTLLDELFKRHFNTTTLEYLANDDEQRKLEQQNSLFKTALLTRSMRNKSILAIMELQKLLGEQCRLRELNRFHEDGRTYLMTACLEQNYELIHSLLALPGCDPNRVDGQGRTALHLLALFEGYHPKLVPGIPSLPKSLVMQAGALAALIAKGIYIDHRAYNGETAILVAAKVNNVSLVRELAERGANLRLTYGPDNRTLLAFIDRGLSLYKYLENKMYSNPVAPPASSLVIHVPKLYPTFFKPLAESNITAKANEQTHLLPAKEASVKTTEESCCCCSLF